MNNFTNKYDETTIFLIIVLFVFMLLILPNNLMDKLIEIYRGIFIIMCLLTGLVVITLLISLFFVFSKKRRDDETKRQIASFVYFFILGLDALFLYTAVNNLSFDITTVFPVINTGILVFNGVIFWMKGDVNENLIYEKQPKKIDITLSLIILGIIFVLCNFSFNLSWITTISICLFYILIRKNLLFNRLKIIPKDTTPHIDKSKNLPPIKIQVLLAISGLFFLAMAGIIDLIMFVRPYFISRSLDIYPSAIMEKTFTIFIIAVSITALYFIVKKVRKV